MKVDNIERNKKELDNKKMDNKEMDNKEVDNKKMYNKESDNREVENKEVECAVKVHAKNPHFLMLTETWHDENFNMKSVFSGYHIAQKSTSARGTFEVFIYTKKGWNK